MNALTIDQPTLDHSVRRQHGFERLEVEGELPRELRGTLYRVGPGLLERFGGPRVHPFDADGAVVAVDLDGSTNRAMGAVRQIESLEFREEEARQRFLYGSSAPALLQLKNRVHRRSKPTGNTNVLLWNDRLYALMENARPVELDPSTLASLGAVDLGVIDETFSAHPHRVAALKTTFNFGLQGRSLRLYALPDGGAARSLGSIDLPWTPMVHDFCATERHLVFFIGPAVLVPWRAMTGIGGFEKFFDWRPELGMQIIVVPLAEPSKVYRTTVAPFWVWHFVNAFESGEDSLVVDVCWHADFSAFTSPSTPSGALGRPGLTRYELSRRSDRGLEVRKSTLADIPVEFPSVSPLVAGARHRYAFLQTFDEPKLAQRPGVLRFDTERGTSTSFQNSKDHLGVEPVFGWTGPGEGDGFVLQLFKDPALERSYLAVLDATRLSDGPRARVWFRDPIPMTFHGAFLGATR